MGRAVARIARWLSLKKSATKKLDTISKAKRLKAKKLSRQRRRKESECVDAPVDIGSTDAGKPEVEEAPTSGEKEERAKSADLEASPKEGAVSTNIASDGDDWGSVGAHALIVKALKSLGFGSPTAIQKEVIPLAIQERCDIVGAAETVSAHATVSRVPCYYLTCLDCVVFVFLSTWMQLVIRLLGFGKDPGLRHTYPPLHSQPCLHH